jgi:hypothetical protein
LKEIRPPCVGVWACRLDLYLYLAFIWMLLDLVILLLVWFSSVGDTSQTYL